MSNIPRCPDFTSGHIAGDLRGLGSKAGPAAPGGQPSFEYIGKYGNSLSYMEAGSQSARRCPYAQ
jgi:hypothetical protein